MARLILLLLIFLPVILIGAAVLSKDPWHNKRAWIAVSVAVSILSFLALNLM